MENKSLFSKSFKVFVRLASSFFICFIIVRAVQIIIGENEFFSSAENNFARIFKTLGVQDRIHFMSVYSGCKIVDGSFRNARVTTFLKEIFWTQNGRRNSADKNRQFSDEEKPPVLTESQEPLTE